MQRKAEGMYSSNVVREDTCEHAYERLGGQVLNSAYPGVREPWWRCGVLKRLRSVCLEVGGKDADLHDLSDLFDRVLVAATDPELKRLLDIYNRYLEPVVARHFTGEEGEWLRKGLKRLVLLRWLGVPYRPGYPEPLVEGEDLLSSLHHLCGGKGLMVWDEGGESVYVVEADQEKFVEWIIEWTARLLGQEERDKAVSDALWSVLFPPSECGRRRERIVVRAGLSFTLSWAPLPGREAVVVQRHGGEKWGLIFESPWSIDLGARTHRAMEVVESQADASRILIWMPRRLSQDEAAVVYCYMAAGRALRQILAGKGEALEDPVVRMLLERYREAGVMALQALLASYREGSVVAEGEIWRAGDGRVSLVGLIGDLIAWAGSIGAEQGIDSGPVPYREEVRSSSSVPPGYGSVSLSERRLGGGIVGV